MTDEDVREVIETLKGLGFIVDEIGNRRWTASKGKCNIFIKELV